ncbi:MAG: glycosyltransferase family 2 protein [Actinomycetota bacterium]|nr:glycosyltransferase family 2 protein [Actinomycetota bacterium]
MISVIVPARDAAATLANALVALAGQRGAPEFEVIVVDSGSRDETPLIAQRAGVRLLYNPGGEPASSRNLGVEHAHGRWLAFTDADCTPRPDWLAAGVRALATAELVQGVVRPAGPAGPFDRTVSVGAEHGLYETANLFVSRSVFERAGGFAPVPGLDIGTGQPFGEDAWFAWRARRGGARSRFAADAVVDHAVFPRGARAWIAERGRGRYFPPLVALIPELRCTFLCGRVFLSPASLRFDLAVAGSLLAAGRRRPEWALAAVPYALDVVNGGRRHGRRYPLAQLAADGVTLAALLRGSISARSAVL